MSTIAKWAFSALTAAAESDDISTAHVNLSSGLIKQFEFSFDSQGTLAINSYLCRHRAFLLAHVQGRKRYVGRLV